MLENVELIENLRSLAREHAQVCITKTIRTRDAEGYLSDGWQIERRNAKTVRVKKQKPHGLLLEHRVWTLLYRMGFHYLSGQGGGTLALDNKKTDGPINQLDVVAIDDEVALAIECKSAEKPSRRPQFQEELAKHVAIRQRFVQAIGQDFPGDSDTKRQIGLAMFMFNVQLSDHDKERAREAKVTIFNEQDLVYYEELVQHLGHAARYQFLADVLPGKQIPGLEIRVPAIRFKMGGYTCYTFSIRPSYLLKIAYVSHRKTGKASDVNAYQWSPVSSVNSEAPAR